MAQSERGGEGGASLLCELFLDGASVGVVKVSNR